MRVTFATNDERTAKRISETLGTATELRAQRNYAGHRLAPWLGHLMVSRQETARPLLTAGEVMQLPPDEAVVMVSSVAPIKARKLRYYADANFKRRVLPPPVLAAGAMPTCRRPVRMTGVGWRFPPCPSHRPRHRPMAWSTWVRPMTAARAVSPNSPRPSPTTPTWLRPQPTSGCSMTTTCLCLFRSPSRASSTRPCSARPGWHPSTRRRNRAMSQHRLNLFIQPEHARRLDELAAAKGVSKSSIVAAALASWLSPDAGDQREAAIAKRLDRLSRHAERLERDQNIAIETLALFIRYFLTVSTPVPEAHQDAARAQGKARFEQFVEQLGRHLLRGRSLRATWWTN